MENSNDFDQIAIKIKKISQQFPQFSEDVIKDSLINNKNEINLAIIYLFIHEKKQRIDNSTKQHIKRVDESPFALLASNNSNHNHSKANLLKKKDLPCISQYFTKQPTVEIVDPDIDLDNHNDDVVFCGSRKRLQKDIFRPYKDKKVKFMSSGMLKKKIMSDFWNEDEFEEETSGTHKNDVIDVGDDPVTQPKSLSI